MPKLTRRQSLDHRHECWHCDFGAGRGDCSFSSYQQCQATASGRDACCGANPYFSVNAELQSNRSRQSPRRF
jgi:Protein of unknown function (DUF3551)